MTIEVTSGDLKSFIPRLSCSNCNEDITSDEELIICQKWDTMSLISNCKIDTTVKFTDQIGNDKVLLSANTNWKLQVNCKITTAKGHARCKSRSFLWRFLIKSCQPDQRNKIRRIKDFYNIELTSFRLISLFFNHWKQISL